MLNRIVDIEVSDTTFPAPDFDVTACVRNSFGLFAGDQIHEVSSRFDTVAAPYLRERKWHSSQHFEEHPDGTLTAHYQLNHLMDIQRFVLS